MPLPPCGLYRTTQPIAGIPAGRLVYFHNHGDPGPGLYLPERWELNRARWQARGHTLPDEADARHLQPLPAEGLYAVRERFHCCPQRCMTYEPNQLVQLGYDGEGTALLFVPEFGRAGLGFPERQPPGPRAAEFIDRASRGARGRHPARPLRALTSLGGRGLLQGLLGALDVIVFDSLGCGSHVVQPLFGRRITRGARAHRRAVTQVPQRGDAHHEGDQSTHAPRG
jgi:hypothetical protein